MKKQPTADFNPRDERLALLLARGVRRVDAAREVGCGERLVYTRLGDPAFRALVAALRARMLDEACGKLADLAGEAIDTLRGLLKAEGEATRLGAARSLLSSLIDVQGHMELAMKLAELEKRLNEQIPSQSRR
jgi:hypothetical protein